jgi:regulator of replication initiation timing
MAELTAMQHNEKVLEQIAKKQAEIDELKKSIKPMEPVKEVSLVHCNADALKHRMAEFARRDEVKSAIEEVAKAKAPKKPAK